MGRVTYLGTYGSERVGLLFDRLYKPDGTKRAVILCHGLNGEATNAIDFPDPVLDEMVRRGHLCATPDLGGKATWGNDSAQGMLLTIINYLIANWGAKAGGALLWAGSMGTLVSMNFLRGPNAGLISALAAALPCVDLADMHDNAVARSVSATNIEAAFGGTLAGYQAALPTHSPAANVAAYQGALKDKIKLWKSPNDSVVIPGVVDPFATQTGIPLVTMGAQPGNGHVFDSNYATSVCDWLESFN